MCLQLRDQNLGCWNVPTPPSPPTTTIFHLKKYLGLVIALIWENLQFSSCQTNQLETLAASHYLFVGLPQLDNRSCFHWSWCKCCQEHWVQPLGWCLYLLKFPSIGKLALPALEVLWAKERSSYFTLHMYHGMGRAAFSTFLKVICCQTDLTCPDYTQNKEMWKAATTILPRRSFASSCSMRVLTGLLLLGLIWNKVRES